MNCLFLIACGNILENSTICIQKVSNETTVKYKSCICEASISMFRVPKLPLSTLHSGIYLYHLFMKCIQNKNIIIRPLCQSFKRIKIQPFPII